MSTDLRIILSNFVAKDVYALFDSLLDININVQNESGGRAGQRQFEQCKKNRRFGLSQTCMFLLSLSICLGVGVFQPKWRALKQSPAANAEPSGHSCAPKVIFSYCAMLGGSIVCLIFSYIL